jgi:hypothetical protein
LERAMNLYDLLQFGVCVFSIFAAGFWLRSATTTQPDHHQGSLGLGVKLVPSLPNSEQVQLSLSGRTGAQGLSGSNHL